MSIDWHCLGFEQLTLKQLYDSLVLRQAVFIVEQDCPYGDADGDDPNWLHLLGYQTEQTATSPRLVAYARLRPPHGDQLARIGRVVVSPEARGKQLGRALMLEAIEQTYQLSGQPTPIIIGAQRYLLDFYHSLGFEDHGEGYLEDGIPHQDMILPPPIKAGDLP